MFQNYADWEYTCAAFQLIAFMLAMGAKLAPGQFLPVFKKPRSFLVALGGHFILHDHISWERWTGIALITLGVILAEETPDRTTKGPLERTI